MSRLEAALAPLLEAELVDAIEMGEVVVHDQPKVALDEAGDWRLHSAEAPVRWQHPRLVFIHPDSFIPLAEETGLVLPLTRYVLPDAIGQLAEWQAAALVTLGLREPVVDGLGRGLELARQLLRRAAHPDQLDHLLPEFRRIG